MRKVTLCFLIDGDRLCLAMKKRGFGAGKWNGVGGKVNEGENVKEAAVREIKEEIDVTVRPRDLEDAGNIRFYFKERPRWNQNVHIFLIKKWSGEPKETEEMKPKWHSVNSLPYNSMWVDDPHWLPKVIAGKKIEGEFHFTQGGAEVEKFEVREIA
ncbi:8-oxo-dGTP diphosphatase [Candidatus Kaiserbacteria bacterium]|nr:8-oxo-dGTP diphosphatase [Candidatus Kaiserbacteria bacterium]